jgi:hypothetical protein
MSSLRERLSARSRFFDEKSDPPAGRPTKGQTAACVLGASHPAIGPIAVESLSSFG